MSVTDIITNKLSKVEEEFRVSMLDNGFVVEVGGRDESDDWENVKVLCTSIEEVREAVDTIVKIFHRE